MSFSQSVCCRWFMSFSQSVCCRWFMSFSQSVCCGVVGLTCVGLFRWGEEFAYNLLKTRFEGIGALDACILHRLFHACSNLSSARRFEVSCTLQFMFHRVYIPCIYMCVCVRARTCMTSGAFVCFCVDVTTACIGIVCFAFSSMPHQPARRSRWRITHCEDCVHT